MPPKVISGGDNPYDIHDAKLSSSATAHESSSVTAHEISNSISMKRDGISLGRTGYSFKINYINSNDKDIIPVFILNSDNTICKDPFSIDVMVDYALIT